MFRNYSLTRNSNAAEKRYSVVNIYRNSEFMVEDTPFSTQ